MAFTVVAPAGARWEFIDKSGKDYPILVWDDASAAIAFYGAEGANRLMNIVTLRTICLGIAKRFSKAGRSPEEAAQQILAYRPGQRKGGTRTPKTRLHATADAAALTVGDTALVTELLAAVASRKISKESLAAAIR